jgi:arylsulfatase A
VKVRTEVYCPDVFQEFALDFIRRHRDGPFFLYYPSHFTHAPILRTPATKPGTESDKLQVFFDNHAYLDRQIGELTAELDRLGIREQTLIVFTGDNGSTTGHNRAAGLGGRKILGGKGTMLEGGTRVPLVVNWRGTTPAGQVCRDLVDFTDFHATFAELAGVERPERLTFDGHSFAPQLLGRNGQPRGQVFVQLMDDWFVRDAGWKLTRKGELFDMSDAPFAEKLVPPGRALEAATQARLRLETALAALKPEAGITGARKTQASANAE